MIFPEFFVIFFLFSSGYYGRTEMYDNVVVGIIMSCSFSSYSSHGRTEMYENVVVVNVVILFI